MYSKHLFIFYLIFCYGCSNKIVKHYEFVNLGNELLVKKDYKQAFHYYEKAEKVKKSELFQFNLNAYLSACHSGAGPNAEKKYFTRLSKYLDCENYTNSLIQKGTIKLDDIELSPQYFKNRSSSYIDSLLDKDQFNRNNISTEEKNLRDSLHLDHFLKFSKQNGFPNEMSTRINCFTSGTGTDLYRLQLLLIHFRNEKNKELDSLLLHEFKELKISSEVLAIHSQKIRDLSRFSYTFLYIDDMLYANSKVINYKSEINKLRKAYGLPTVKQEYLLIKNLKALQELGYLVNVRVDDVSLPSIPDGFLQEEVFLSLL
jgi:hypothetical protein